MGVLDGLSEKEAVSRYPEFAVMMESWRNGLIEIHDLCIPNMTDPLDFYESMSHLAKQFIGNDGTQIFIGTRSVLIGLTSVLLGRNPTPGGGYREIQWMNLGWIAFHIDRPSKAVVSDLKGVHL